MAGLHFFPALLALLMASLQTHQGFPMPSLSSLLSNAVQRANYLHNLAGDRYRDFEQNYISDEQRHSIKNSPAAYCYSESSPAPTGKEDARQKSDMDLLRFSLSLIQAWISPLQILGRPFGSPDAYDKLLDLEKGLQVLMRELEDGSSRGLSLLKHTYDKFSANQFSEEATLKNYSLLACFKKDMHKVETYLRVMKCRRFPESNCTI
ncbi:somatotropin isoform X2 [Protopterus annectens]|uniref:Somatotropin n=1 Tax=Protopterus annectens TaxID=7888 RepID=SOMA_PROAN|nr:somatotropin isoform X2 [Protopterus annectens]O73848.1 RecName: Full=Somatotropin; AltName: Full=Growth hormone; Flags: Precursor [Protopterus annectens]AAC16496.1 growth hormone precursor [Protopterus annectens]